ncbi:hypothetical protein RQP46_008106 [Phenoliferia psychrophenolica]
MATFAHLAPELLSHILKLSIEGEPAKERQRFRLAFELISRACFHATADTTEFCVQGVAQAQALATQLEQEKKWAAQEERKARSGRTSRSDLTSVTRVSNIRRLSLIIVESQDQKLFLDLLRVIPNLIALELVVGVSQYVEMSSQLAVALGGLVRLQELQIRGSNVEGFQLLKILIPLKALEVLDIDCAVEYKNGRDPTNRLKALRLPNLRKLRISLEGHSSNYPNFLFGTLASNSSTGIRMLELISHSFYRFSSESIEPIIAHLSDVVHLTWVPPPYFNPLEDDSRDAVLTLLGAMTSLNSISMGMWTTDSINAVPADPSPIDHTLFDTLATLPSLETVKLIVQGGALSTDHVLDDQMPGLDAGRARRGGGGSRPGGGRLFLSRGRK